MGRLKLYLVTPKGLEILPISLPTASGCILEASCGDRAHTITP